ncbi:MAG: hypothetical protein QOI36_1352 [Pseudonocardiales bacterium]|nr:hypothetical protein [Pseudonocardiales bacterium]
MPIPSHHLVRRVSAAAFVALAVLFAPGTAAAGPAGGPNCTPVRIPVALTAAGPTDQHIDGTLCADGDPAGRPLQILVHGFTLTRDYWNMPGVDSRYSYVAAATARGYATLAIDRIGVGTSSKPPAAAVTLDSNVEALHHVIIAARGGAITGAPVQELVLVGHSFGSAISVTVAGRYRDVDAVVATSFLHTPGAGATGLVASTYPAQLDSRFSGAGLPVGYLTTLPGSRAQFYQADNTDPAVIDADERTKGTGTVGDLATFATYFSPLADGSRIQAPLLLAIGQDDPYFCGVPLGCPNAAAVVAREAPFFGPAARLTGYVAPGIGHNLALHRSSPGATGDILDWIDHTVPATAPAAR